MEEYFIEEWEYVNITHEIIHIEETSMNINNLKVIFKTRDDSKEKNIINYMVYIPYSNDIFTQKYEERFDYKNPTENDEFNDELAKLRDKVEEGIERYLEKNKKLIEIDYK
ncbi:hypothetical protein [Clostridioides sp. ZZV15-6598]|uniref:hypothetical protein n=1 Tax=Clostridioides sp. ZZV15-6598 TaxID=2811501 RepID=UPI001D1114CB|nr:hypothetical protein [Clostridioides sp. ZZV15-6598]